ncbi:MAG: glutamate--tRNA ligase [Phycisphaerae bacterium]
MDPSPIRVRFAPSPTGYLHIGGARTALFNWLLARKTRGQFVLRIEDTDRSRHVSDSVDKIAADLRWLGLNWDEGPQVGGDVGPYFQSERLDVYRRHCDDLIERGLAYYALETPDELNARRESARAQKKVYRYQRPDPLPTPDQAAAARDAGKPITVRFMVPDEELTITDQILGDVRLAGTELEDFVIQKSDGWPTYHFACVVDDALMKINLVLRGQEHLINTPKHVALQRALGFDTPRYAHLPIICNMDGSKMSKRTAVKDLTTKIGIARKKRADLTDDQFIEDMVSATQTPRDTVRAMVAGKYTIIDDHVRAVADHLGIDLLEINVHDFRLSGYLPEAVLNFISLLGWSAGEDREQLTLDQTIELFDVGRIGKTNARFDRTKLMAFNTDWCNRLAPQRLAQALDDYLAQTGSPFARADAETRAHLLKVCAGFRTFKELDAKCSSLFADDDAIQYDPKSVKKNLQRNQGAGYDMLETILPELQACDPWDATNIEALFDQICAEKQAKLGQIAQPIRVAITGTSVSPPIYDTLAILGKEKTLIRIQQCMAHRAPAQ